MSSTSIMRVFRLSLWLSWLHELLCDLDIDSWLFNKKNNDPCFVKCCMCENALVGYCQMGYNTRLYVNVCKLIQHLLKKFGYSFIYFIWPILCRLEWRKWLFAAYIYDRCFCSFLFSWCSSIIRKTFRYCLFRWDLAFFSDGIDKIADTVSSLNRHFGVWPDSLMY